MPAGFAVKWERPGTVVGVDTGGEAAAPGGLAAL